MRTNKEKFDLIISLGAACSCTQTLRAFNLQDYSYPFNWMYGTDFYGRCKILADNFYRFIKKEDLIFKEKAESMNRDIYYNEYNKLTFNHDFISGVEFNKMHKEVEEKYKRRINRLLKKIKKSKKILMVYIETPDKKSSEADNSIIKGYNLIKEKFNKKQMKLLYFFNDEIRGGALQPEFGY